MTYDQNDQTSWEQYPPPVVFENYWGAHHYMKQQEELVGRGARAAAVRCVWTWRLNRYNAICVIQKLYRTQIESKGYGRCRRPVRLEQLQRPPPTSSRLSGRAGNRGNFVANKLREKRRAPALAFRKKRLLAALLIQARARGMICREGIRRKLMEEAWKRQQGMAQVGRTLHARHRMRATMPHGALVDAEAAGRKNSRGGRTREGPVVGTSWIA